MAAPMDQSDKTKFQTYYESKRTPGSWKERYRKRCFENLKKNRANLLAKFRHSADKNVDSSVKTIMEQEWRMLQYEDIALPNVQVNRDGIKDDDSLRGENLEEMLWLFEEIEKELREQEQSLMEEYEKNLSADEVDLSAHVDHLSSAEVICPVCQRNPMMQNVNVIFCKCGVRINTQSDALNLRHLASNLETCSNLHSHCCTGDPRFSVLSPAPGLDNIVMTCQVCEFMFIVI